MIRLAILWTLLLPLAAFAETPQAVPRPIPLTRPEMKRLLEDVKFRQPRIPLPELTEQERAQLGDRADSYESRLRFHYLDGGENAFFTRRGRGSFGSSSRESNPDALDYGFKVELFWIVSRANNCQYCLGHQESKLLGAGRSEDRIAALDGDWQSFSPAEQAAFAFARKFTYQPHLLSEQDIHELKQHYTEPQIVEMMLSMGWNNSINRWKEGVAVPQNRDEGGYSRVVANAQGESAPPGPRGTYLTPTSQAYQKSISLVAPIKYDSAGKPTELAVCVRPALEDRHEVEQQLERAKNRQPRLELADWESTRQLMSLSDDTAPQAWLRLFARVPEEGPSRAKALLALEENADLDPLLKAQLSWIVARQDRAWYATGQARQRLKSLGQTDEQIYLLDGDWGGMSPAQQTLFRVAQKLSASPVVLTDADVAAAVKSAGPAAVVQTINYASQRAAFNRVTEASGLPLD